MSGQGPEEGQGGDGIQRVGNVVEEGIVSPNTWREGLGIIGSSWMKDDLQAAEG